MALDFERYALEERLENSCMARAKSEATGYNVAAARQRLYRQCYDRNSNRATRLAKQRATGPKARRCANLWSDAEKHIRRYEHLLKKVSSAIEFYQKAPADKRAEYAQLRRCEKANFHGPVPAAGTGASTLGAAR